MLQLSHWSKAMVEWKSREEPLKHCSQDGHVRNALHKASLSETEQITSAASDLRIIEQFFFFFFFFFEGWGSNVLASTVVNQAKARLWFLHPDPASVSPQFKDTGLSRKTKRWQLILRSICSRTKFHISAWSLLKSTKFAFDLWVYELWNWDYCKETHLCHLPKFVYTIYTQDKMYDVHGDKLFSISTWAATNCTMNKTMCVFAVSLNSVRDT